MASAQVQVYVRGLNAVPPGGSMGRAMVEGQEGKNHEPKNYFTLWRHILTKIGTNISLWSKRICRKIYICIQTLVQQLLDLPNWQIWPDPVQCTECYQVIAMFISVIITF